MITVNETLFSKLVSGGEACLLTIDGEYGGYVKAGSAFQDIDGKFKVELVEAERPVSFEATVQDVACNPYISDGNIVIERKEVEHIDTGFEDLLYVVPTRQGYSIALNTLTKDQLNFLQENIPFEDHSTFYNEGVYTHISFSEKGWFYSHPIDPKCYLYNNTFNDIFV